MSFPPGKPPPKQALALLTGPNKISTYEATGGSVTAQFAVHNLSLIDAIPSGSSIHDNACGPGTVSRIILTSNPPSDIKIQATDTDQVFLDSFQENAKANAWPVEITNQKSESLSFPDDYFTHSITNIAVLFFSGAGLDGTKEIYRTLKPGGTAIVNCWEQITWMMPVKAVHDAMRPGKAWMMPPINWTDGQQIQKVMLEAGFQKDQVRVEKGEAWAKTHNVREWAEKAWAFLGGLGGWEESDGERWDEAVDLLVERLKASPGTKIVDGEVHMKATQWVVIAKK